MQKRVIYPDFLKAKGDPKARRKCAEMIGKILAIAAVRAPGKEFNAILTGAGNNMSTIGALSVPEENILLDKIQPWDLTLFGKTADGINIIHMLWLFPDIAVIGRFDPEKCGGERPDFPFTDYAVVHFDEILLDW